MKNECMLRYIDHMYESQKILRLTNSLGSKTSLKASVINKVIMFPMAFVINEIAIITAFIDSGACNKKIRHFYNIKILRQHNQRTRNFGYIASNVM